MADQQHQHLEPRQSAFAAQQAQSLAAEALQEGSPMRSPSGPMAPAALGAQPFASPAMMGGDSGAPDDRQRTPSAQLPSPGFQGFGPAPQPGPQQSSQAASASSLSQPPVGRCDMIFIRLVKRTKRRLNVEDQRKDMSCFELSQL
jgi:hypothetical protein